MSFGIDVSHWQNPASVPWDALARQSGGFVICRTSYGTLKDRQLVSHVRHARAAGVRVGLYHFFRDSQPVADQMAVIRQQAEACGYEPGDICPWLDIELDPVKGAPRKVSPAWSGAAFELLSAMRDAYGNAGVYITQIDWQALGSPGWVLDAPLWAVHWTGASKPATPGGRAYALWQFRVGPFAPVGVGGSFQKDPGLILDQNRSVEPLPECTRLPGQHPLDREIPAGDDDDDWDELCANAMAAQQERIHELVQSTVGDGLREMSGLDDAPPTERDPGVKRS